MQLFAMVTVITGGIVVGIPTDLVSKVAPAIEALHDTVMKNPKVRQKHVHSLDASPCSRWTGHGEDDTWWRPLWEASDRVEMSTLFTPAEIHLGFLKLFSMTTSFPQFCVSRAQVAAYYAEKKA